ncbi:DNRLRE domain-containing protein [Marininema halotolerans]|uniref:RHS repeat-associated core domain-containing protein n=1 Tax=Marininema halotolerans TaxID=1155944 RepID=A0A1I6PZZ1_9BACL|nr:DNRLRE domain-containing protein [Marininema halotolerans]SFS45668.1 RHS repeat-associated core domain-containing protein [Marininema halotolerans]
MKTKWRYMIKICSLLLSFTLIVTPDTVFAAKEGYSSARYGMLWTGNVSTGFFDQVIDGIKGSIDDVKEWVNTDEKASRPQELTHSLPVVNKVPKGKKRAEPKRVKEIIENRSEKSKSYRLSDGRVEVEISEDPFHYKDKKGNWKNIDETIRKSSQEPGFQYGNETNTFKTYFGNQADQFMKFKSGKYELNFGLNKSSAKKVNPTVHKNKVSFSNALSNAKLDYEIENQSVKEKILLDKIPESNVFTFHLDSKDVVAKEEKDGSISLMSKDGDYPVFTIPKPYMYDSHPNEDSPHGYNWSDNVTQRVKQVGSDLTITVTADSKWLKDSNRKYPVTVDPTIIIQPTPEKGMGGSKDAMIDSASPTTNFNDSWKLSVGSDAKQTLRSLVKFDLSAIPQGSIIDAARVQLYYDQQFCSQCSGSEDVKFSLHQVKQDWDPATVTWKEAKSGESWTTAGGVFDAKPASSTFTVDNTDSKYAFPNGSWNLSSNESGAQGGSYHVSAKGSGADSFTWKPYFYESGDYKVEAFNVGAFDRATNAPFTINHGDGATTKKVNQRDSGKTWVNLGTYHFWLGDTHSVVLKDNADNYVIADALRFTKEAVDVRKPDDNNHWHDFAIKQLAQKWIDGTDPNYGVLIKGQNEAAKLGGVNYTASNNYDENGIRPVLKVVYGKPSVNMDEPTTIHANGAELQWTKYDGDDFVEYQVHRSRNQTFTPDDSTLVAPIQNQNTVKFQDTTAEPTPAYNSQPFGQAYFYMIAVKTKDGEVIPSRTQLTRLPKSGQTLKIFQNAEDTTLSSAQPTSNFDKIGAEPWVMAGSNSGTYGNSRSLFRFDTTSIPAKAKVLSADLNLWAWYQNNTGGTAATYQAHALNKAFSESGATWKSNATGYSSSVLGSVTKITNDPKWHSWAVTSAVQSWVNGNNNYGLMVKHSNEDSSATKERVLFTSSELTSAPQLRPQLKVLYIDKTAANSYYAPKTPTKMLVGSTYDVDITLTNATNDPWQGAKDRISYHWALPDGTDQTTKDNQLETEFKPLDANGDEATDAVNIAPGETVTVRAKVKAPDLSEIGKIREGFMLKWDLKNDGEWLSKSSSPVATLNQYIVVEDPDGGKNLGFESNHTDSQDVDTSSEGTASVNLYRGNANLSYSLFDNPSRGLSTGVDLTYNSLDTSESILGMGWSMSTSSLVRMGSPSDNLVKVDSHDQVVTGEVNLIDDDGTSQQFIFDPKTKKFVSPKGSDLYVQYLSSGTANKKWLITDDERNQYYFDDQGYVSEIDDSGGEFLKYAYEEKKVNNKPEKLLRYITDSANRKTLTIEYTADAKVDQLIDVSGRVVHFSYDPEGHLEKFVDGYGKAEAKTTTFSYDLLFKNVINRVKDPRGNETKFDYYVDGTNKAKVNSITDRDKQTVTFTYNGNEKIETDALGHQTKYAMDNNGMPTSITNANNQTTKFQYDADQNMTRMEAPNGAITTWSYDQYGNVLTMTDPINNALSNPSDRKSVTYKYQYALDNHIAELVKETSPEGRWAQYTYDAYGNPLTIEDAKGKTTYDYYGNTGLIKTITDAEGRVTTYGDANASNYGYSETGQAKIVKDALGQVTTTEYGPRGEVLSVTDAKGNKTTTTYDIFGRILSAKIPKDQAKGEYIQLPEPKYDGNDNIVEKTTPTGAKYLYKFNENDDLIEVTEPKDKSTDPEKKTTYEYDKLGHLLRETEPKGNLTPDDPNDYVTRYEYDDLYQLVSVKNWKGDKISYDYDNVGNQTKVTEPKGNLTPNDPDDYVTTMTYDLNNRPIKVTDSDHKSSEVKYDADGLITQSKDNVGNINYNLYDEVGQLIEERDPHDGNKVAVTKYEYDKVGNVVKVDTPKGTDTLVVDDYVEKTVYDKLDRVKEVIFPRDPLSADARESTEQKMIYNYDENGNVVSISTPPSEGQNERNVTSFSYFDNGWIKGSKDDWNQETFYDYNADGQQTVRTVKSGDETVARKMMWDFYPDGKIKHMVDDGLQASGSQADAEKKDFEYRYDVNDNLIQTDDHSSDAPTDTFKTTFNDLNQVSQLDEIKDGKVKRSVKYAYDVNGNVIKQELPENNNEYTYDPLDQLTKISHQNLVGNKKAQDTTYAYTDNGLVERETKPNGNVTNYSYYPGQMLKQMQMKKADGTTLQQHELSYDLNGNITQDAYVGKDADNHAINDVSKYAYDARDRLTSYQKTGTHTDSESYVLDANDNIVKKVKNGSVTSYTYDRNRLKSETQDGVASTYQYDAMGRLDKIVSEGKTKEQYTYDQFDRTIEHQKRVKDGSALTTTKFKYDPLDRTIAKTEQVGTENEKTTAFNYLGLTEQVVSEEVAGEITRSYAYTPWGELLSMYKKDGDETSYYQDNVNDDVELLTDENGNIRGTYGYTPYGEDDKQMFTGVDKPDPSQPAKEMYNPYRYGEDRWDPNTESYDLGFRDYKPSIGRFTTPDSFTDSEEQLELAMDGDNYNLYAYAAGNPVMNDDPDGHWSLKGIYKSVKKAVKKVAHKVKKAVGSAVRSVKKAASHVVKATKKVYHSYVKPVVRYVKKTYNRVKAKVKKAVKKAVKRVRKVYKKVKHTVKKTSKQIKKSIHQIRKPTAKDLSEAGHTVLDVAGLVPGFGEVADGVNAGWYALEGDYVNAGLSTAAMVPLIGWGATGAKVGGKVAKNLCFVAGTKVLTNDGDKPIEKIKVGDKVLSKDEKTGKVGYKKVKQLFRHQADAIYTVTVGNEKIQITAEHPFWVKGKGWVKAKDLQRGDLLVTDKGKVLPVKRVTMTQKHVTVYNFEVEDYHTYFVSDDHVWVHNKCSFADEMSPSEAKRYNEYWSKRKAPHLGTPGEKYQHYRWYNGKWERSTVINDHLGRQKYRIDHNDHSMPQDHSAPHLHEFEFKPGYSSKGKETSYHFWD